MTVPSAKLKTKRFFFPLGGVLLSAFLFYLSFPNRFMLAGQPLFAWFAAVPFLFSIDGQPISARLGWGSLFGLVFYALLVQWFRVYSIPGYLFFVGVLSLQPVLFSACCPSRLRASWANLLLLPSLWAISEYFRQIVMRGFGWSLGMSQAFWPPVLQIVDLVGATGLAWCILLVNTCFYFMIRCRRQRWRLFMPALICVIAILCYGWTKLSFSKPLTASSLTVGTIQPNISFQEKLDDSRVDDIVMRQLRQSEQFLRGTRAVDLMVWPETAVPADFFWDESLGAAIRNSLRQTQRPLLTGAALWQPSGVYNSAVLLDVQGGERARYNKRRLVPFSEYVPGGGPGRKVAQWLGIKSFDFKSGDEPGIFRSEILNDVPAGLFICSEDTVESFYRQMRREGARLGIVLLNDAWFEQKAGMLVHGQNAVVQAAAFGLPILRVANNGWTALVDGRGRILPGGLKDSLSDLKSKQSFVFEIPAAEPETFYSRFGDKLCWIYGIFVIILIPFRQRKSTLVHDEN